LETGFPLALNFPLRCGSSRFEGRGARGETFSIADFRRPNCPEQIKSIGRQKKGVKNMKRRMVVWMLVVVFVFSMLSLALAQETKPAGPPPVVSELVAKAKAAVKVVSAEDVKAAIDNKEKAVFLDVRDAGEYTAGHLPGAINVSRGTLEFNVWGKIPDQNAKVYVYCKTTGRSALATKTLNDLGYKNAVLMGAQFEDWIKKGYPVER
jgi:rhodanese-related sulfurtransferase